MASCVPIDLGLTVRLHMVARRGGGRKEEGRDRGVMGGEGREMEGGRERERKTGQSYGSMVECWPNMLEVMGLMGGSGGVLTSLSKAEPVT